MTKHEVAFDLTYYTDAGERTERVYLHRSAIGTVVTITVYSLADDTILGVGDDKAEAIHDARVNLHREADFGVNLNGEES